MRLLLLACSKRKHASRAQAFDLYDGVFYRIIKAAERRNPHVLGGCDVLILSAKYGLVRSYEVIGPYDQKMTRQRARELRPTVHLHLRAYVARYEPADVFVCLGSTYRLAIDGALDDADALVTYAKGGLGRQMQQLKRWLEGA
jgi:hypothetical protein